MRIAACTAALGAVAALFVIGGTIEWSAVHRGGPSDGALPALAGLPPGYGTALYVPAQAEAETGQALAALVAVFELVRSSRESLEQAESLRGTAARLAQISRENAEAHKEESDPAALQSARYQQLVAESQLALAEGLLASARKVSEGTQVLFEIARQNALRLQGDEGLQEPETYYRPDAPGVLKTGRPQGAARRSRHA